MLDRRGTAAPAAPRMARKGRIEQRALPVPVAEPAPRLAVVEPLSYPDSDGHFLPDNPLQANAVVELRVSLREHFRKVPNVVVEGDMFLYYAEGEAEARIAALEAELARRGHSR